MTDYAVPTEIIPTREEEPVARWRPQRRRRRIRNFGDRVFFGIIRSASFIPVLLILLFVGTLVAGAIPAIKAFGWSFPFSSEWQPNAEIGEAYGALPFIYGTLFSSVMALLLAGPVGIGVAVFLNEVVGARLRSIAAFLIEILATVPSIVFGIWAFFVLVPFVRDAVQKSVQSVFGTDFILFRGPPLGIGLLAGTLVLAVMILPMITSISLDAIRMVPSSYREAALGLGATRWEMIRLAVLPAARSGLIGACILALGRALGETMAVTMVIGNKNVIRWSLFEPSSTISSVIASNFGEAGGDNELMLPALLELALILFAMTLVVNLVARMIIRRFAGQKGDLA